MKRLILSIVGGRIPPSRRNDSLSPNIASHIWMNTYAAISPALVLGHIQDAVTKE
jgi:hypothetical protein